MTDDILKPGRGSVDPRDDARSVDELMTAALCESDEDLAWDAVCALQWRGSREVMDRAVRLCGGACAFERRLGADILGQLGVPSRSFPDEGLYTLVLMLETEQDPRALRSILVALSHHGRSEAVGAACGFEKHPDPDVRHAVVLALMGQQDGRALATLAGLTRDPEANIRDWATFALGTQVEADTPELREALVARLADEDDDTRAEAIVGLARRGDRRMLPALHAELASGSVGRLAVEAAAMIGDPLLQPLLVSLRVRWNVDAEALEEAIRACSSGPAGMG